MTPFHNAPSSHFFFHSSLSSLYYKKRTWCSNSHKLVIFLKFFPSEIKFIQAFNLFLYFSLLFLSTVVVVVLVFKMEGMSDCVSKYVPSFAKGLQILLVDYDTMSLVFMASMLELCSYKGKHKTIKRPLFNILYCFIIYLTLLTL